MAKKQLKNIRHLMLTELYIFLRLHNRSAIPGSDKKPALLFKLSLWISKKTDRHKSIPLKYSVYLIIRHMHIELRYVYMYK